MSDTNQTLVGTPSDAELVARARIGRQVVYFALAATSFLGVVAISVAIFSDNKERFAYVKDVLTIVLPLLGTWVGTVLAFYFSRENFVAAAEHTASLVRQLTPDQRLQSIAVTEAMIEVSAATTTKLTLTTPDDAAKLKLKADVVDALLEKNKRNRLPILDGNGKVLFVIHRSFIDKFLVKKVAGSTALADVTLQDLLNDIELKAIFQSFATVGREARLIAVKQAMDGNPNCEDAFVTEDGSKATKAVGWITNEMVREKSTA